MLNMINKLFPNDHYEAAHLIGATLGGPNDTRNMVPLREVTNRKSGGWGMMENFIRSFQPNRITGGWMEVRPHYSASAQGWASFIPDSIYVKVKFSGKYGYTFDMTQTTTKAEFFQQLKEPGEGRVPDWYKPEGF